MYIAGIGASLPSRIVTNDDVIELIREHSTHYQGDIERLLPVVKRQLETTGLQSRRWREEGETALEHIGAAVDQALAQGNIRKEEIDLLLFVGVGRGFLEPANASVIANALGFYATECFDITDACMSWVRGLEVVQRFFTSETASKQRKYNNVLIINGEFNAKNYLNNPESKLTKRDQLSYIFPSWTIGEAATATLLAPSTRQPMELHIESKPEFSALCSIPLPEYRDYVNPVPGECAMGPMAFTSYGLKLHKVAHQEAVKIFRKLADPERIQHLFVHASSKKEWDKFAKEVGMEGKVRHIYPETGNLVSASIPAAIHEAVSDGTLQRGDQIGIWVGSAGMSFAAAQFTF